MDREEQAMVKLKAAINTVAAEFGWQKAIEMTEAAIAHIKSHLQQNKK
jgi:hypothetical protein